MGDGETVWVLPSSRGEPALHTDRECSLLTRSDRDPIAKPRGVFPDWRGVCSRCTGEIAENESQREPVTQRQDRRERRQGVYEALAAADAPLSRRDVQLEAMLSLRQARTTLAELQEMGQVEKIDAGLEDGRIPKYRLAVGQADAPVETLTERAQVDPVSAGIATVFAGLLLAVGYVIGAGVIVG